ncbi:ABC transporter permease [Corynebacterium choanae]|uniref:FtsX-like permease family protein n=1 Tax=Corynebacterium choanae TaxID=1862358 RepID=A0A3G6J6U5_9CORY|nr:ABC transporter permease [Corynebacterium choanae]AZA13831.1 FtsX-like permease family protein [Corynebacterium choanae]
MFVALHDLRHARGRFAIITITVALMATLVSFLSGLTGGLTHQTISGLSATDADTIIVQGTEDPSIDRSHLDGLTTAALLADNPTATAVTVKRTQLQGTAVSLLQLTPGAAAGSTLGDLPIVAPGNIALSAPLQRDLGVEVGDTVTVGSTTYTVVDPLADLWLNHAPIAVTAGTEGTDTTLLALAAGVTPQLIDNTQQVSGGDIPLSLAAYAAEHTSLSMINLMLVLITGLITGAFFVVWTMQRSRDIAVMKALGATTASICRDALGQAAIIVLVGIAAGVSITLVSATAIGDGLPFVVTTSTTLLPAGLMLFLGLAGAATSLVLIGKAQPLQALQQNA